MEEREGRRQGSGGREGKTTKGCLHSFSDLRAVPPPGNWSYISEEEKLADWIQLLWVPIRG